MESWEERWPIGARFEEWGQRLFVTEGQKPCWPCKRAGVRCAHGDRILWAQALSLEPRKVKMDMVGCYSDFLYGIEELLHPRTVLKSDGEPLLGGEMFTNHIQHAIREGWRAAAAVMQMQKDEKRRRGDR